MKMRRYAAFFRSICHSGPAEVCFDFVAFVILSLPKNRRCFDFAQHDRALNMTVRFNATVRTTRRFGFAASEKNSGNNLSALDR